MNTSTPILLSPESRTLPTGYLIVVRNIDLVRRELNITAPNLIVCSFSLSFLGFDHGHVEEMRFDKRDEAKMIEAIESWTTRKIVQTGVNFPEVTIYRVEQTK